MKVSLFACYTEPPATHVLALDPLEFMGWLENHKRSPHSAAGFSPAIFKDSYRNLENVIETYALGLDADKGEMPCEAAAERYEDFAGALYSTKSWTADTPRWRALLFLSRPATAAEYAILHKHFRDREAKAGITIDNQAKDASRFWYPPSLPTAGGKPFFRGLHGDSIDVDALLTEIAASAAQPEQQSPVPPLEAQKKATKTSKLGPKRYAERALALAVDVLRGTAKGERNGTLASEAYTIGQIVGAGHLARSEAQGALRNAISGWDKDYMSKHEDTLNHQLDEGAKNPRQVPELKPRAKPFHRGTVSTETEARRPLRGLLTSPDGKVYSTPANVAIIVSQSPEWAGRIRYNDFTSRVELCGELPIVEGLARLEPGTLTDPVYTAIGAWLHRRYGLSAGQQKIAEGVASAALAHRYNPLTDWLSSLKHDGVSRLATFATTYLGAKPTDAEQAAYLLKVPTAWMVGAVARALEPGCQNDHVLVFKGGQGKGKSSAARTLGEPFFTDELPDISNKDASVALRGAWIVELSELDATAKAEVEKQKQFISRKVDRYRPPYGRETVEFKRTAVFIATTNADTFLRDPTGARRWWPITVGDIDLATLRLDREQLWAEAVELYRLKQAWWPDGALTARAAEEQEAHYVEDAWEAEIGGYLAGRLRDGDVTSNEILSVALGMDADQWNHSATNRVGAVLRRLNYERKKLRIDAFKTQWVWRRVPAIAAEESQEGTRGNSIQTASVPSVPSVPSKGGRRGEEHDRPIWDRRGQEGTAGTRPEEHTTEAAPSAAVPFDHATWAARRAANA